MIDKRLSKFTAEAIRSRKQRSDLMRDFHDELFPGSNRFTGNEHWRTGKKPHSEQHRRNRIKGRIAKNWEAEILPQGYRFGHCLACKRLTISVRRSTNFHRRCYLEWCCTPSGRSYESLLRRQKEPSLPAIDDLPGQWAGEEDLRKYFAWAVQHYFGNQPYRDIAEKYHVAESFIRKKIQFLFTKLPEPLLLPKPVRRRILLLLESR
jgi:hypothetical protein